MGTPRERRIRTDRGDRRATSSAAASRIDFLVPGDPLTPGWASVPGAKRIAAADAVSIPKIISAPMSYRDARVILEALGGPEAPAAWRGALPLTYHAGGRGADRAPGGPIDSAVRQIQTVVGRIRGSR